jgi:hypothetical protein
MKNIILGSVFAIAAVASFVCQRSDHLYWRSRRGRRVSYLRCHRLCEGRVYAEVLGERVSGRR